MRTATVLTLWLLGILIVVLPTGVSAQNRVAFVSSIPGPADMSSWPGAEVGLTGLEAADSICMNLAKTASLPNPGNFVAWLSDDNDDAYCRVHQLSGKKASNCSEASLPDAAGPWSKSDKTVFGAGISDLLLPGFKVYKPLNVDENGVVVPLADFAWTATNTQGSLLGDTCTNWTSDSGSAWLGSVSRSGGSWTQGGTVTCSGAPRRLYCLETLPGAELQLPDPPKITYQLAFATHVIGSGDLSSSNDASPGTTGIEAGDSICNNRASARGLAHAGSYKAWLSDANTNARDRYVYGGPWYRLDGFQIAQDMDDLIDGSLNASNNMDELGRYLQGGFAWTGTQADGTAHSTHCDSWTSDSTNALGGELVNISGEWTSRLNLSCSGTSRYLHCLSDFNPDVSFEDGFELRN